MTFTANSSLQDEFCNDLFLLSHKNTGELSANVV